MDSAFLFGRRTAWNNNKTDRFLGGDKRCFARNVERKQKKAIYFAAAAENS